MERVFLGSETIEQAVLLYCLVLAILCKNDFTLAHEQWKLEGYY